MINSGVSKEEVLNSFEDLNLQTNEESPDAPKDAEKIEDLLGQPSGKFNYKVFYSKRSSYDIPIESITPEGWGDEFKDDELINEKDKGFENSEQPQKEVKGLLGQVLSKIDYKVFPGDIPLEEIMPTDSFELLSKKEICMVEV